jgi:hypothetical protein
VQGDFEMTARALVQQMLTELEWADDWVACLEGNDRGGYGELTNAITAAREYLAAPEQSEPVGYAYANQDFIGSVIGAKGEWAPNEIALYTHPAPYPTELTDEEIRAVQMSDPAYMTNSCIAFARAVLAAQRSK